MCQVILTCNYSPWSRYCGGGQKSVHKLASELSEMGIKTCVVYSKAPWEKVRVPPELPYRVEWAFFAALWPGISSPLRFLNGIFFYLKVRRLSGNGTALHGNGDEAGLLWAVPCKGRFVYSSRYPRFHTYLQGSDWSRWVTWFRILFKEPRFVAMALAMRRADSVTCTSGSSLEETVACFPFIRGKTEVVPNGIDPAFAGAVFAERGQRGVLYFGRLTKAKGVDLVLESYGRLPAEARNRHPLKIIGQGPALKELREMAGSRGLADWVHFQGWMDGPDLAWEIVSHKLVFLPSREESFGNTMVEVLVTGQTLLTSRKGSIPEVTGPWGEKADIEDRDGLARILEGLLQRTRPDREIREQRNYFLERYSWRATALRFRELYGLT